MDEPTDISAELKSFLREWITGYEQLQTLLLLHKRRDERFAPGSVAEVLRISETVASEALDHLCRASLVEVQVANGSRSFKYAPASDHLAKLVDQLAAAWDENLLAVMNLMSSNAIERVRTRAILTFADAFVLGRKKTDG